MDHLTALKVFRTAARSASFAEASRQLGLSAGAISKNVSELEAYLKVRLFNRTTRRRSLTEAGAAYLAQIEQALDSLERAEETVRLLADHPAGVLRVAAPASLSLVCFSKIVPRFLATYPDVSLRLDLDDRKVDLVEGGYDIAVRGSDRLEDSSLMARALTDLPHVVCAAPAISAGAKRHRRQPIFGGTNASATRSPTARTNGCSRRVRRRSGSPSRGASKPRPVSRFGRRRSKGWASGCCLCPMSRRIWRTDVSCRSSRIGSCRQPRSTRSTPLAITFHRSFGRSSIS